MKKKEKETKNKVHLMKDVERGEKGTKLHATGSALYTYRYLPLINTKHVLNFFYCHLFRVHELLTTTLFMLLCNRSHTHTHSSLSSYDRVFQYSVVAFNFSVNTVCHNSISSDDC